MEHQINALKTFRYYTFGNKATAKHVWVVLHGYGQLPEYFIHKFQHLDPAQHFVIAPEGMHRFYLEGTNGRVGASWMTKEARLNDIHDNIQFLNTVWTQFEKYDFKNKILLGFSQGGATAARWHENGTYQANHFVLWASIFPPDLDLPTSNNQFLRSVNHFFIGDKDPYFIDKHQNSRMNEVVNFFQSNNLPFVIHTFDGQHEIPLTAVQQLERLIESDTR
jgi:predicted esterase